MRITREAKLEAIDANLEAFIAMLPDLLRHHRGEYVVLRHGQPVSFHADPLDAQIAGNRTFDDEVFSVQQVTDVAAHLGFHTYAVGLGQA